MPPRIVRVCQAALGVHGRLPSINPRPIGGVVVRLQPLPGLELHIRHDEVELQSVFVGVLNPQAVVLIGFQARQ